MISSARGATRADPMLESALYLLAHGEALGALRCIALREDAIGLALRGVAMAQLGDLSRAKELLSSAVRAFGTRDALSRARAVVALTEVTFALRELSVSQPSLVAAERVLAKHDDSVNALHAKLLSVRRLVLLGELARARKALSQLRLRRATSMHVAIAALIDAELSLRELRVERAQTAIARARNAAAKSGISALLREVDGMARALQLPAARVLRADELQPLTLSEVAIELRGAQLVVDGCRRCAQHGARTLSLRRRPVLFALLRELARAWPLSVPRDHLITRVFGATRVNDSHRARLRVELGRLRKLLRGVVNVSADSTGFALVTRKQQQVLLLLPPVDGDDAAVLALLADGAAWSSSALALALGTSQRSVQRALLARRAQGQARALGRGRAQRWLAMPRAAFATTLLLPTPQLMR